jgi:hypothetical protein
MQDDITRKMSESDDRILTWDNEDRHWRERFGSRPYVTADRGYDFYRPAYRYGWESAGRHQGRTWNDVEPDLERGWTQARGESRSTWDEIKAAVRDAWERVAGGADGGAKRDVAEGMNPDAPRQRDTR